MRNSDTATLVPQRTSEELTGNLNWGVPDRTDHQNPEHTGR